MGILQSSGNKSHRKEIRETSVKTRKELLSCDNAIHRDHGGDKKQSRSGAVLTATPLGSRGTGSFLEYGHPVAVGLPSRKRFGYRSVAKQTP